MPGEIGDGLGQFLRMTKQWAWGHNEVTHYPNNTIKQYWFNIKTIGCVIRLLKLLAMSMASNPSGRTRDHIPRQAKSASQAKSALELNIATGMPMNEGVHVIEQKYASGALMQTTKCIGCQAVVKHIKKHLAWKPDCQRFYCDDELKSISFSHENDLFIYR